MREAREDRSLRWTLGCDPAEPLSSGGQLVAAGVVAMALGLALLLPMPAWARPLAAALVLAAAFGFRRAASRRLSRPSGFVVLDEVGVHREGFGENVRILRWGEPFGVTLLASRAKDRLVCALTTPSVTRYLSVRVVLDEPESRDLLARAATVSDDDIGSLAGEDDVRISAPDAVALLVQLQSRAAGALDRIYLTAPRGERIELDGIQLRVGDRVIDLSAPLEWRAFLFHESGGRVAALYQATWVRQADAELVLVAPTPGEIGYTDEPPPRELRLAIDRIFMLPLRRALERAPRASRPNVIVAQARTERRA